MTRQIQQSAGTKGQNEWRNVNEKVTKSFDSVPGDTWRDNQSVQQKQTIQKAARVSPDDCCCCFFLVQQLSTHTTAAREHRHTTHTQPGVATDWAGVILIFPRPQRQTCGRQQQAGGRKQPNNPSAAIVNTWASAAFQLSFLPLVFP